MERSGANFFERQFHLSERNTNVRTELMAGMTTFMTMSYILAVNPEILSAAGMDKGGVFTATVVSSIFAIILMAFLANLPFALAPGMGLNAFFAYTVVLGMGHDWKYALSAVFLEGVLFIVLSFFKVREAIFNAIPVSLKKAVSVGIGLFIALIGLVNGGVITHNKDTIISLGNVLSPTCAVFFFGFLFMAFLTSKNIRGALLYGIIASTALAVALGVTKLPPLFGIFSLPPSLAPVAFQVQWHDIFSLQMFGIMFTFLFVDIFDTVGTITGVATKANLLDREGKLDRVGPALLADAIGTTAGALLGTSTVTTFVESASGVAEGGRTGLTALSTGFFFFLSLFIFPLISVIPGAATAPALVMVGLFMMSPITEINFNDYTESIPAFLTIVMMPFAYSIAEGIAFGMMSYVILKLITGRHREISPLMFVLALIFLARMLAPLFK